MKRLVVVLSVLALAIVPATASAEPPPVTGGGATVIHCQEFAAHGVIVFTPSGHIIITCAF